LRRAAWAGLIAAAALSLACQRPARIPHAAGPELLEASRGAVDELVRHAQRDARHDGRQLLVYISASWCKPCVRFQKAVQAGQLNATFPTLRLLKFDQDRDLDRLLAAGYQGHLIPRFVVPGPDGRGTARLIEGGTSAEDTVATSIGPRLQRLLDGGSM
jgi:hypothetical protein